MLLIILVSYGFIITQDVLVYNRPTDLPAQVMNLFFTILTSIFFVTCLFFRNTSYGFAFPVYQYLFFFIGLFFVPFCFFYLISLCNYRTTSVGLKFLAILSIFFSFVFLLLFLIVASGAHSSIRSQIHSTLTVLCTVSDQYTNKCNKIIEKTQSMYCSSIPSHHQLHSSSFISLLDSSPISPSPFTSNSSSSMELFSHFTHPQSNDDSTCTPDWIASQAFTYYSYEGFTIVEASSLSPFILSVVHVSAL